jgi:hypothetical protein
MKASPWQLVKVREGQKGPDGKQKRQPKIYSTIRIHSKFEARVIVGHLKPDLDAMDIGLNLKDVQLASTEVKYVILGLPPTSCPEGLRRMVTKLLYKLEMEVAVSRKLVSQVEAGSAELHDVYFCRKGIKTTRLVNPQAKEKFRVDRFDGALKTAIVVETPVGRTAIHAHLLNLASESGTIKTVLGERATLVRIPEGNISDPTSVSWMEKVHTQIAFNFHSDTAILCGVMDTTKNVHTKWRDDKFSESPSQNSQFKYGPPLHHSRRRYSCIHVFMPHLDRPQCG